MYVEVAVEGEGIAEFQRALLARRRAEVTTSCATDTD